MNSKIFIPLNITVEEFDVLLRAIDFYNYATGSFEYGEHIEECQTLKNKIMRNLKTKEEYLEYISKS